MWLTSRIPKISQQVCPRKRQKAKPCGGLLEGFAILDDVDGRCTMQSQNGPWG